MNTIEETLAWAGIASALAVVAGLLLGFSVGHKCGKYREYLDRLEADWNKITIQRERLAAERAKRDGRGRFKKVSTT